MGIISPVFCSFYYSNSFLNALNLHAIANRQQLTKKGNRINVHITATIILNRDSLECQTSVHNNQQKRITIIQMDFNHLKRIIIDELRDLARRI